MTHPAIRDLFQSLSRDPAFQEVVSRLIRDPHARQSLSGLTTTAKALYIVLLWQATERNVIVVVDGNKQAETARRAGGHVLRSPGHVRSSAVRKPSRPWTCSPRSACRRTAKSASSAPSDLWRMASRKTSITITPVASALLRTEAAEFYRQLALTLRVGEEIPLEDLLAHLESIGYETARPGGNGRRIFAARRHPGYFPGRSLQAHPHRAVRRPDRIHSQIRCRDPAVGDEDRGGHACCRWPNIRNRASCFWNWPIRWMSPAPAIRFPAGNSLCRWSARASTRCSRLPRIRW